MTTLVINLDSRPDRLEHITAQLESVGITDFVRIPATVAEAKTREAAHRACLDSHVRALTVAKGVRSNWCLIVEDDATFNGFEPRSVPAPFELYYFGGVPSGDKFMQTHCYGVRTSSIPFIIDALRHAALKTHKVDLAFSLVLPLIRWGYHPALPVTQAGFKSDVSNL